MTGNNTPDTESTGEEMLREERGKDTGRAGRAVRPIDMMVKDVRLQMQLNSAQVPFAQA